MNLWRRNFLRIIAQCLHKLENFQNFPIWLAQFYSEQDACTGVHSACRREENGHNLDICILRRLRLRQGQMQGFRGLKVGGGGLNLQIWELDRAHETERTVFLILQVFSMCRCKLWHKRKHKGYSTNSAMNTLWTQNTFTINKTCWQ